MLNLFELPKQGEFILYLESSGYSDKTLKNYKRDLSIFSIFLAREGIEFEQVNKKTIILYKSFLQTGEYLKLLKKIQQLKKENEQISKDRLIEIVSENSANSDGVYRGRYGYKYATLKGLNGKSINRLLSCLRSYLKFLVDFDYPTPIPSDAIKLVKNEKKVSMVAEFDELIKFIESPSLYEKDPIISLRNRSILEVLFSTGMRISELINLNIDQLNSEGKIYIIGKGKKGRFVYLTERAKYWLNKYLETRKDKNPYVFIPYRGGRNGEIGLKLSANYIEEKLSKYKKLCGIVVPTTPHSLRHGFATYLAENGASPVAIQILLGHESLNTTTRYVHASDRFAEKAHKEFHPLKK